jgi:hypothetical protein
LYIPSNHPDSGHVDSIVESRAECRVPSAECRVPSAECQMPSAECRVPSAECRVPSAECRVSSAECRVPSAECRVSRVCGVTRCRARRPGARHGLAAPALHCTTTLYCTAPSPLSSTAELHCTAQLPSCPVPVHCTVWDGWQPRARGKLSPNLHYALRPAARPEEMPLKCHLYTHYANSSRIFCNSTKPIK